MPFGNEGGIGGGFGGGFEGGGLGAGRSNRSDRGSGFGGNEGGIGGGFGGGGQESRSRSRSRRGRGLADPGGGSGRAFRAFDRGVSLEPAFSVEGQQQAVDRVQGSALSAFARGDFATGLEFTARNVGNLFGFEEELAFDPVGGFGTRVGVNFLDTLSMLPVGAGVLQAMQALNVFGPFTAASMASNALGQRATIQKAAALAPTVDLGFRATTQARNRAQAKARAGQALSAADQLALGQVTRERERQERQRSSARDDSTQTPGAIAPRPRPALVAPTPAPPVRSFRPAGRGARLLAGQDPSTGLDLLRTGQQAAVAQGLAPARPNVGIAGRPPRAAPLV